MKISEVKKEIDANRNAIIEIQEMMDKHAAEIIWNEQAMQVDSANTLLLENRIVALENTTARKEIKKMRRGLVVVFIMVIALALFSALTGCASPLLASIKREIPDASTVRVKLLAGRIETVIAYTTVTGEQREVEAVCVAKYEPAATEPIMYRCVIGVEQFVLIGVTGDDEYMLLTGPGGFPLFMHEVE